jgi:hypothetical protein
MSEEPAIMSLSCFAYAAKVDKANNNSLLFTSPSNPNEPTVIHAQSSIGHLKIYGVICVCNNGSFIVVNTSSGYHIVRTDDGHSTDLRIKNMYSLKIMHRKLVVMDSWYEDSGENKGMKYRLLVINPDIVEHEATISIPQYIALRPDNLHISQDFQTVIFILHVEEFGKQSVRLLTYRRAEEVLILVKDEEVMELETTSTTPKSCFSPNGDYLAVRCLVPGRSLANSRQHTRVYRVADCSEKYRMEEDYKHMSFVNEAQLLYVSHEHTYCGNSSVRVVDVERSKIVSLPVGRTYHCSVTGVVVANNGSSEFAVQLSVTRISQENSGTDQTRQYIRSSCHVWCKSVSPSEENDMHLGYAELSHVCAGFDVPVERFTYACCTPDLIVLM